MKATHNNYLSQPNLTAIVHISDAGVEFLRINILCNMLQFPDRHSQLENVTATLASIAIRCLLCLHESNSFAASIAQRFTSAILAMTRNVAVAAALYSSPRSILCSLLLTFLLPGLSIAVTKLHVISLGKWTSVQWTAGTSGDDKPILIRIRPLIVDGRIKEYVTGAPHEITERLFVVRRVFRVNDNLPDDSTPQWQWQRGGWLIVDRLTGRISAVNLPEFDVVYSAASWYRDYIAYCGISDDGNKRFAIVAELNRRKPVLKKALAGTLSDDAGPDAACPAPTWLRTATRVTFESQKDTKQTFAIRGHVVDLVDDAEEEEGN